MIPEEAVEAAAKVIYEDDWHGPPYWESLGELHPDRLQALALATRALEAAAPHMLAGAWEQGVEAKSEHPDPTNPYRPAP